MSPLPSKTPTPIVTDREWTVLEYFLKRGSTFHSGPNFYSTLQNTHPLFQPAANQKLFAALSRTGHETLVNHSLGRLCLYHDCIAFIRSCPNRPIGFLVAFSQIDLGEYCALKVEDIWQAPGQEQNMESIRWDSLSVPSWTLLNVLLPKYGILIAPHRLLTEPLQPDYWEVRQRLWSTWELRLVPHRGLVDLNQDRRILTFKGLDLEKLEDAVRRPMTSGIGGMTTSSTNDVSPRSMFNAIYIAPSILKAQTTEVIAEYSEDPTFGSLFSAPNKDLF